MSKQTDIQQRPDHHKTGVAIHEAVEEVQHVARPRRSGLFSWFVALGTGAWVVWRGFTAAQSGQSGQQPLAQDQAIENLPVEYRDARLTSRNAASQPAQAKKVDGGAVELGKEFIARYNADDCPARAAALSFFGLLSLVPLMLFAVAALGFFIHDPNQARQYVEHVVSRLLPGEQASRAADQVIQQTNLVDSARALMKGKWWSILFGFVSLIYAGLGLFVSAADPMNAAWEVKENRSFLRLRLVCLEVFAGAGLFFLLSLAVSAGLWHPAGAPWIVNALLTVFYEALAIALNGVMFTLIYRFLPNTTVTWKAAAFGGIITGILYEIAKKGFEFYLTHFGNLNNKMYGALGGIVLLVTWIYYGSMLLLAGAIVAKMYHEHREEGGVKQKAASSV